MCFIPSGYLNPLLSQSLNLQSQQTIELIGDIDCEYGSPDCNPCAYNLLDQIENLSSESNSYRFPNGALDIQMNFFNHPQSIARIPGVRDDNWIIISRNHPGDERKAGVVGIEFSENNEDPRNAWSGSMKNLYSTGDNKHPGGSQLIGHNFAVAHEAVIGGMEAPTWISFYDVSDPEQIGEINRFCFNGADADGTSYFMTKKGQAMCVGLNRLESGHYLMFALESRRRMPTDVGWFFLSSSTDISTTDWQFIQSWSQEDLLPGKNDFRTYENINIITDCSSGHLYMLGFYGKGRSNTIDVFRIINDPNGKIKLEKVLEKKIKTSRNGASFRAGAAVHVTPENELVLYTIQKSGNRNWVTIEEFNQKPSLTSQSQLKILVSPE